MLCKERPLIIVFYIGVYVCFELTRGGEEASYDEDSYYYYYEQLVPVRRSDDDYYDYYYPVDDEDDIYIDRMSGRILILHSV